jgi:hypothetical protein
MNILSNKQRFTKYKYQKQLLIFLRATVIGLESSLKNDQ